MPNIAFSDMVCIKLSQTDIYKRENKCYNYYVIKMTCLENKGDIV